MLIPVDYSKLINTKPIHSVCILSIINEKIVKILKDNRKCRFSTRICILLPAN